MVVLVTTSEVIVSFSASVVSLVISVVAPLSAVDEELAESVNALAEVPSYTVTLTEESPKVSGVVRLYGDALVRLCTLELLERGVKASGTVTLCADVSLAGGNILAPVTLFIGPVMSGGGPTVVTLYTTVSLGGVFDAELYTVTSLKERVTARVVLTLYFVVSSACVGGPVVVPLCHADVGGLAVVMLYCVVW